MYKRIYIDIKISLLYVYRLMDGGSLNVGRNFARLEIDCASLCNFSL